MKKLSANSKLGQRFVEAYRNSNRRTLEDVYDRPSAAKQAAFEHCLRTCEAENGKCLRVISADRFFFFTVAFQVENSFGATELRVISRSHDYLIYFGTRL